jgi:hypothetical protein
LGALECKITELESMRRTLASLIERCRGDHRPDCPILDDFENEARSYLRSDRGTTSQRGRLVAEER